MLFVIPSLLVVIILGVVYTLWKTTRTYGGLIGSSIKWIGIGMLFFTIESADRALGNLSVVNLLSEPNAYLIHNIILLLGLLFCGLGFSKLTRASK